MPRKRPGVCNASSTRQSERAAGASAFSQRVVWLVDRQQQSAELHVNPPPHLGPVEVMLNLKDDGAHIAFCSPHAAVRDESRPRFRTCAMRCRNRGFRSDRPWSAQTPALPASSCRAIEPASSATPVDAGKRQRRRPRNSLRSHRYGAGSSIFLRERSGEFSKGKDTVLYVVLSRYAGALRRDNAVIASEHAWQPRNNRNHPRRPKRLKHTSRRQQPQPRTPPPKKRGKLVLIASIVADRRVRRRRLLFHAMAHWTAVRPAPPPKPAVLCRSRHLRSTCFRIPRRCSSCRRASR